MLGSIGLIRVLGYWGIGVLGYSVDSVDSVDSVYSDDSVYSGIRVLGKFDLFG